MCNKQTPASSVNPDFSLDPNTEQKHQFVLAEYNRLCSEIQDYLKESSACVTYAIASSAAVWAWIAANPQWNSWLVNWLPFILNVFLCFRWLALQQASGVIGDYLKKIEKLYFGDKLGWELIVQRRADAKGSGKFKDRISQPGTWGISFFVSIVILSFIIAISITLMKPSVEIQLTQKAGEVVKAIDKLSKAQEALKKQLTSPSSNGSLNASPSPPAKSAASSTTPTSELPKP